VTEWLTAIRVGDHPDWIDYNGHVTDAAYAAIAAEANEQALAAIGLSEAYRAQTGRALYTARLEIDFRAEIATDSELEVASTVDSVGRTSVVMTTRILRADGDVSAETRHVYVHVDGQTGATVALSPEQRAALETYAGG
jgi:YbgC/YbaW family acyl-CoA thioester hydrolase